MPTPTLLQSLGAAICLYVLYRLLLPRPIPGIPCNEDSARRIAGDVPYILELKNAGKLPRQFWSDLCRRKQSPVVQFFPGPFNKPMVVVSDYAEVRDILGKKSRLIDKGEMVRMMWSGLLPTHFIGFSSKHKTGVESRALVKDLMSSKYLATVSSPPSPIYGNINNLIDLWSWKQKRARGRPFEAMDDLCSLTADIIFETALGKTDQKSLLLRHLAQLQSRGDSPVVDDDTDAEYPFTKSKVQGLLKTMVDFMLLAGGFNVCPVPSLFWPLTNLRPSVRRLRQDVFALLSHHIDDAVARRVREGKPATTTSALDLIVGREMEAADKQGRAANFQQGLIHDALYGYCLGGQDTTHASLAFLVKHLGEHALVQKWLRTELRQVFTEAVEAARRPTMEEMRKAVVPRVDAYIEEVLRLNPIAPAIPREAMEDCTVLGYRIPKGTTVLLSVSGPSMTEAAISVAESVRSDNKSVSEPDLPLSEFRPERWLKEDPDTGRDCFDAKAAPQLAFSMGPRECWGKRLAYLQLRMFLIMFLWHFECLELSEHLRNWDTDDAINARPKTCLVRLEAAT